MSTTWRCGTGASWASSRHSVHCARRVARQLGQEYLASQEKASTNSLPHASTVEDRSSADSLALFNVAHALARTIDHNGAKITLLTIRPAPDPSQLPDYVPPFAFAARNRGVGSDAEGNLWLRTVTDSTVYDVVSRTGTLIDRVRIPGGTYIEGFGPGVVYISSREATGMVLARATIH